MLKATLKDIDPVQEGRLIFGQAAVGDEGLEDLLGVRAPVWEQADQARSGATLENLDIGVEHSGVIAGHDHRAVGVVGLGRLKGIPPLGRVEPAAEVLLDREVERFVMLTDGLKEASQPGLLGRERVAAKASLAGLRSPGQLLDRTGRTGHLAAMVTASAVADGGAMLA